MKIAYNPSPISLTKYQTSLPRRTIFTFKLSKTTREPCGVVVNVLDCDIKVS